MLLVPEYYQQHITIELITCLPKTDQDMDAIATFIDHLPKYTYFIPVTTLISADNLAQVFFLTVITQYGVSERHILDCDPHFVSAF